MTAPHPSPDAGPDQEQPTDDATVKMPRPRMPTAEESEDDEDFDPESTLVRNDWESTVIRQVAPHVAAIQSEVAEEGGSEDRFGWEAEGLKRLASEVRKSGG
ncbi:MAG TPA: hypothetical protein VKB34_15740 [Povalibacter sp.]|nr:hypothetical protein [Povalibacter sp.]